MSWVESRSWDRVRGRQLKELLVQVYSSDPAIQALLDDSGISREYLPAPDKLGLRWHTLLRSLLIDGLLVDLLETVIEDHPGLRAQIEEIERDDVAPVAGNPADPYQVRLVGPGRRPLVDRVELRQKLREFLGLMPVLVVRGPQRCGKSFSFELIRHVLLGREDVRLIAVDFSQPACGSTASDLMRILRSRLGLPDLVEQPLRTTRLRTATELVDDLVGDYHFTDTLTRIIVIDGLNRLDLDADVPVLAAQLAKDVVRDQLPGTKLVLTGYDGDLDRDIRFEVLTEQIGVVNETHVRLYFEGLVTPTPIDVNQVVREAMTGPSDLEELADRVRGLSLRLLEA